MFSVFKLNVVYDAITLVIVFFLSLNSVINKITAININICVQPVAANKN